MTRLVADGRDVAPLEVARSLRARSKGLLGRQGLEGALLLQPGSSVHTIGMRFPIDVAFVDRDMVVLDVVTMAPNRLGRPRLRSRSVLEAEAGSFQRWAVRPGVQLSVSQG